MPIRAVLNPGLAAKATVTLRSSAFCRSIAPKMAMTSWGIRSDVKIQEIVKLVKHLRSKGWWVQNDDKWSNYIYIYIYIYIYDFLYVILCYTVCACVISSRSYCKLGGFDPWQRSVIRLDGHYPWDQSPLSVIRKCWLLLSTSSVHPQHPCNNLACFAVPHSKITTQKVSFQQTSHISHFPIHFKSVLTGQLRPLS